MRNSMGIDWQKIMISFKQILTRQHNKMFLDMMISPEPASKKMNHNQPTKNTQNEGSADKNWEYENGASILHLTNNFFWVLFGTYNTFLGPYPSNLRSWPIPINPWCSHMKSRLHLIFCPWSAQKCSPELEENAGLGRPNMSSGNENRDLYETTWLCDRNSVLPNPFWAFHLNL